MTSSIDGEWYESIIDNRLYLERAEYENSQVQDLVITSKSEMSAEDYERLALTSSYALYFAGSSDRNETSVPLIEKAYARAHGDYGAIRDFYIG